MRRTKAMRTALILALVAVLLVGATWAYLSKQTNKETNAFSFMGSDGLDAKLDEPHWSKTDTDDDGVPDAAQDLTSGKDVPKDPRVTNTGKLDEYVAIKLTFQDGAGVTLTPAQMTTLMRLIQIQYSSAHDTAKNPTGTMTAGYNTNAWKLIPVNNAGTAVSEAGAPVQHWYYVTSLINDKPLLLPKPATAGDVASITIPLFDNIHVNNLSNEEAEWLCGKGPLQIKDGSGNVTDTIPALSAGGGFKIYIEGAAIQADVFYKAGNTTADDAADLLAIQKALYGLLDGVTP